MKMKPSSRILFILVCHSLIKDSYSICYDLIGCFESAKPYHNALFFLPQSPSEIEVQYDLFTRRNADSPQILTTDVNVVRSSKFDGSKDTKFIIHGYKHSTSHNWETHMKNAILTREDVNVILVDWVKGANKANYAQVVANTRVVGALLALLMKTLNTVASGNYFGRMHLIGHSLGAHVSGYAGERIPGIGRITGLDPAGPLFEGTHPKVRLDPTDAEFVDVIHTNGHGFGIKSSVGHLDFYPNGGQNQPGCETKYLSLLWKVIHGGYKSLEKTVGCSHMRAVQLFIESIYSQCQFLSYPCATCTTCGNGCAVMGYNAPQENHSGDYFFKTKSNEPFCISQ